MVEYPDPLKFVELQKVIQVEKMTPLDAAQKNPNAVIASHNAKMHVQAVNFDKCGRFVLIAEHVSKTSNKLSVRCTEPERTTRAISD